MRGLLHGAAALAACVALVGCAALEPPDAALEWEELDLEPRIVDPRPLVNIPTGPVVEVLRGTIAGRRITMSAYRDPSGLCIGTESDVQSGMSCGLSPHEDPRFGRFGMIGSGATGTDLPVEVSGVVASDVAAAHVELRDGRLGRALLVSLSPAEIDALLFVAYLPPGAVPVAAVALDADGEILDRFSFAP